MLALVTNLLILTISDAMVTCYLFTFYLHVWSFPTQRINPHHLLHFTYSRICRGTLPWLLAAGICRGNLTQEFAVGVCRGYLPWVFCICKQIFVFVYESKFFLYGSKPFLYMSKTFLFVRFSLLTVFLFFIAVTVMGHRKKVTTFLLLS